MAIKDKQFHESIAIFFEQPTREGLRDLLRNSFGELDHCDFKAEWPRDPKVAKHILGFANSGGGVVVVGVKQNEDGALTPVGLSELKDKADIDKGVKGCIPTSVRYIVLDFAYQESEYKSLVGKKFQVLIVEDDPSHIPYVCKADSDGTRTAAVYVRKGTETVEANYEQLQELINRRMETGYTSTKELALQEHLEQLKVLYDQIPQYVFRRSGLSVAAKMAGLGGLVLMDEQVENPLYPKKSYQRFIARAIEGKKRVIEELLGLRTVK